MIFNITATGFKGVYREVYMYVDTNSTNKEEAERKALKKPYLKKFDTVKVDIKKI